MGEHRLAGRVADRIDARVRGAAAIVDGDEAARVGRRLRTVKPDRVRLRAPTDGDEHAVESRATVIVERRLDGVTGFANVGDFRAKVDRREELLAAARERLDELAVDAGQ